jgi:hypothetical protein
MCHSQKPRCHSPSHRRSIHQLRASYVQHKEERYPYRFQSLQRVRAAHTGAMSLNPSYVLSEKTTYPFGGRERAVSCYPCGYRYIQTPCGVWAYKIEMTQESSFSSQREYLDEGGSRAQFLGRLKFDGFEV